MCMHMCVHIWVCPMPQPHSWFWQMKPSFVIPEVGCCVWQWWTQEPAERVPAKCSEFFPESPAPLAFDWCHLWERRWSGFPWVTFDLQVTKLECPTGKFPNSPRRCWMLSVRSRNAGSGFVWHLLLLSSLWWLQWEVSRTDLGIWTPAPKLMAIFGRFGRCGFVGVSRRMQALRV